MTLEELKNKTFIGVVEDNADPKRLARLKIRVMNVFDQIPTEDIPWSSPWKDLNGNAGIIPEIGKVMTVVFDNGNPYKPEYVYADHFNINLENKLKNLSDSDYASMRAILFDHKTQIYSNDGEGLKIDYKINNINITDSNINLNLKDNFGHVNIGTATANQQTILGNNFMNWFSTFVDNLLGTYGGPYLANLAAPVVANPAFIDVLLEFKELLEPKFLSHHVNVVDNEYVDRLEREAIGQLGDAWKSTINPNGDTSSEPINFNSNRGNSTDTPDGVVSPSVGADGTINTPDTSNLTLTPSENPDIIKILNTMKSKGYEIVSRTSEVNIVGVRRQYEGDVYSNTFKDDLYVIYKDENGNWLNSKYSISTMPGFYMGTEVAGVFTLSTSGNINIKQSSRILALGGLSILAEAQYINIYSIGTYLNYPAMISKGPQKFYRDKSADNTIVYSSTDTANAAIYIHAGFPGGTLVNNMSEGSQVFANENELVSFFNLCNNHSQLYGNNFNYTLLLERDII